MNRENNCYESTTSRESCSTNEFGDLVCDRIQERWQYCNGQKPQLISRTTEEGIKVDEISPPAFQTQFPVFMDQLFSQVLNGFDWSPFQHHDPFDRPKNNIPQEGPIHRSPELPPDCPETQHWRKDR